MSMEEFESELRQKIAEEITAFDSPFLVTFGTITDDHGIEVWLHKKIDDKIEWAASFSIPRDAELAIAIVNQIMTYLTY